MFKVLSLVVLVVATFVSAAAQTRQDRKHYVDDKVVSLRTDKVPAPKAEESSFASTSYSYPADEFKTGVVQVGPRTTYLKEGLSIEEVVRLLGKPSVVAERNEQDTTVTIYEFPRSEGYVLVAEFVKGSLVRSAIEERGKVVHSDR